MTTDEKYMRRCLDLARLGAYYVAPNPMVGAVLVRADGLIIGEGFHQHYGGPHAEVECLRDVEASACAGQNTTLYVSLEPCSHWGKTPPCADLIVSRSRELGIRRVVAGCTDPNPQVAGRGIEILRAAGIEVTAGVLEQECRELNKRFFCLQEKKRPYVTLKWAQSADGYIDGPRTNGEKKPVVISNALTKQLVHKLRAENMAILIGSGTALMDNPRLMTTHWSGRNPIRVLLDRRGRVPHDYNIFSKEAQTIVLYEEQNWQEAVARLGETGIHSVLVEGGATLLNHILQTGIWDEMHVEVNPHQKLGGGTPAPAVSLPPEPVAVVGGNLLYERRNGRFGGLV